MNTDNKFYKNIQNLTTSTMINSHDAATTRSAGDNNDVKHILSYAIPLSCAFIVIILLIAATTSRRSQVLETWLSLKRMRNTNPCYTESAVLRRDSESDSYNESSINVTTMNEDRQWQKESNYHLATIT